MDLIPWILIVQLWTDPPPKIKFVYSKVYPNYTECMEARKEWDNKGMVAICGVKSETNKDASTNLEPSTKKTTR
jgi:hypothetical protein